VYTSHVFLCFFVVLLLFFFHFYVCYIHIYIYLFYFIFYEMKMRWLYKYIISFREEEYILLYNKSYKITSIMITLYNSKHGNDIMLCYIMVLIFLFHLYIFFSHIYTTCMFIRKKNITYIMYYVVYIYIYIYLNFFHTITD